MPAPSETFQHSSTLTTVEELCSHLTATVEDAALLCDFARIFFARVPRQLLEERDLESLAAMTRGAFALLEKARPDRVTVQVLNPEEEGWDAPVTIIRAEMGDRPFIVDTLREYLAAENIAIEHYIYPVLRVERDGRGRITAIEEPGDSELEALVHCEVGRIEEMGRRREIRREVERRLRDVVAATTDFRPMLEAVDATLETLEIAARKNPDREAALREAVEFMQWLRADNFVFLGYRSYSISGENEDAVLRVDRGSGLGILKAEENSAYAEGVALGEMEEELRRRVTGGPLLIISKTNAEATVHRRARMDYVGVKMLDEHGNVVGERRFLGLFTSKAYAEHAQNIPILRRKLDKILERSGSPAGSHDYKEIITIFNSMPKEDLFQASPAELDREVREVLALLFTDEVHVTLRHDPLGRGVSVMVILPRGKFSAEVRHRIQDVLGERFRGQILNYHLALSAGDQARLHFYISPGEEMTEPPSEVELVRAIGHITRSWDERLEGELEGQIASVEAHRLARLYGPALSEEYRAANLPAVAVHDIEQMEKLRHGTEELAIDFREPRGRGRAEIFQNVTILKLYLRDRVLVLSDFMPILENCGVRVLEVAPFAVQGDGLPPFMIYSFAVQGPNGEPLPLEHAEALAETILAVRRGDAPDDWFNGLVLRAGLDWREVQVLRAYANYAFQVGAVPARSAPARALLNHPEVARLLFELFRVRFDPDGPASDPAQAHLATDALRGALGGAMETVATLADDRALRRLTGLIEGTVRTNHYCRGPGGEARRSGGVPYLSLKFQCVAVEELRRSRLLYEIFVYSSRMEGVHLRGAAVSRGGIRWSDRPDDFRTEVMGLVQTQIVKNAVIVPGGSKGGFITKRHLDDREEMMAEAAEQYRTLIRGMLDITDNLVDGDLAPPDRVVRHDGDDPYLVVAADKGTAHLSDVANAVAEEYGYWLGDAFASGGSYGYDHKKEGITARGAWECVKRHFREMGKDIQSEPFTVIGIGDMSGDVFGNGMLLSQQIRLLAAFDHRHVFIDPDPDPESSYLERERVFKLPRSSWLDYDRKKMSRGGMVVPRASKEVKLTPEARAALGMDPGVEKLDGEALVRAVLSAPAELLWNGGIGTYVKDREETHADAGDSANDPVRVDADQLRCQVIGEGGNLGMTQQARIRYALAGGRLNTDALDNSAGVDMSDHEVNLKILLNPLVSGGKMDLQSRNRLLERMTDDVSHLVLRNNRRQSLAVSLDEHRSRAALGDFAALISAFERDKLLERGAEGLPSSDTIQERAESGLGLTRPGLSVLLAYAKLHAQGHLLGSSLPDSPAARGYLVSYFPRAAAETAGDEGLASHRLCREIVTSELTNDLVDLMGSSFLHHAARDAMAEIPAVVRAWMIASHLAGAPQLRADLERLELELPAQVVYRWYFGLARVLDRTTHWILANVDPEMDAERVVSAHLEGLSRLRESFSKVVAGADRELFRERLAEIRELGAKPALAHRVITLRFLPQLLDILRIAQQTEQDPVEAAGAYYRAAEQFACALLRQRIRAATRDEAWAKRHAQMMMEDVDRAHRGITSALLRCRQRGLDTQECAARAEELLAVELESYRTVLAEIEAGGSLSGYAVATRMLVAIADAVAEAL
jgi:glutamate dehydrogenase